MQKEEQFVEGQLVWFESRILGIQKVRFVRYQASMAFANVVLLSGSRYGEEVSVRVEQLSAERWVSPLVRFGGVI